MTIYNVEHSGLTPEILDLVSKSPRDGGFSTSPDLVNALNPHSKIINPFKSRMDISKTEADELERLGFDVKPV